MGLQDPCLAPGPQRPLEALYGSEPDLQARTLFSTLVVPGGFVQISLAGDSWHLQLCWYQCKITYTFSGTANGISLMFKLLLV